MILTEERREVGEWENRENIRPISSSSSVTSSSISSTSVSSSTNVVCIGEEFPADCVADMELQTADNHHQSTTTITTTATASVTSTSTSSSSSSFASSTYTFTRDAGSPPSTKPLRTCRVCGDKAKSMHFGGLSCDSCKAFFRRAVHNDTFANFTCPYDGTCVINITSRKCCQYCRYQKCMSIGMERSWVMSEEDRQQLMRQRAERKAKAAQDPGRRTLKAGRRELVPFEPDPSAMLSHMTPLEWKELEQAVRNYRHAYTAVPYSNSGGGWEGDGASLRVITMFSTVVRRFAHFARLFPEFCDLPEEDQSRLLRYGILEMSLIRGVQSINTTNDPWPSTPPQQHHHHRQASPPPPPTPPTPPPPALGKKEEKQPVTYEVLQKMHVKFVNSMRELGVDEAVLLLLLLVVLFSSDRPGLQAATATAVQARQDRYLQLLRKYLGWRHGPHNAPILYPRLLLKLTDLRELNDQHTEYHLRLARQEIAEIQTQLGCLNLNHYAEWPSFMSSPQTSPGPHTASPGPLAELEREAVGSVHVNMNPQSSTSAPTTTSTAVFKGEGTTNPLSSAILASLDLERLVNSPAIQRLILHQFQRSVVNVLGLAGLFPETKPAAGHEGPSTAPTSPHSTSNPPAPASLPTQTPHTPHMSPSQASLAHLSVPLSAPQQNILQGCQVSDLMAHLDNLNSTSQPQASHSNTQQQEQSQQAFQQLEEHLMNGVIGHSGGGMLEGHSSYQQQQIQQQQQQQEHQSCHYNQLTAKQMEEMNCTLREGLVIPKQEPLSSPMFPVPTHVHYDHPLMYDDPLHPLHHPHHHQDAMDSTQPSRSALDLPELEKFQEILEHKMSPSFDSPPQQKLFMMAGQFMPHHHHHHYQSPPSSPPQMILHHSQPPPAPQLQQSSPSMHHTTPEQMQFSSPQESQGYQMSPETQHASPPHHHYTAPHPHLCNHTPFTSNQGFVSHVEGGVGGGDGGSASSISTYSTQMLKSSPPPPPPHSQHHFTTSENVVGFHRELQHRATPPQNSTLTTIQSSPPPPPSQHHFPTTENFVGFCRELQHRTTPPQNSTVTTTQPSPPPQFPSHHHQPLHHHQHHHQEFVQRVASYS